MHKFIIFVKLLIPLSLYPTAGTAANKVGNPYARSYIVINESTGTTLKAKNIDQQIQPASLTKVLSLYVILDAPQNKEISLHDRVSISKKAWETVGSQMFLEPNTDVDLEELEKGMAIISANDTTVALAEYIAVDVPHFVERMNEQARLLGMNDSRFIIPHGRLAKGEVTTVRDMVTLSEAYILCFPWTLSNLHSQQSYSYNKITQPNRNLLLGQYPEVDGLKTGFTRVSGYHTIVTAQKDHQRYIIVLKGAGTPAKRNREAVELLRGVWGTSQSVSPCPSLAPSKGKVSKRQASQMTPKYCQGA
jgi:D-alanyl-D-alanine carboxypeptidase (penicillin-binding protein 5/6)